MGYGFLGLVLLHQFVFSDQVYSSFIDPKWACFSLGFLGLFLIFQFSNLKAADLSLPPLIRSVFLVVLGLPLLVDIYLGSPFWVHTLGISSLTYVLVYCLRRGNWRLESVALPMQILLIFLTLIEFLGLSPFYQGTEYHLSGLTGNPNLLAACLLFWFWLAISRTRSPRALIFSTLGAIILTFSRAAILGFFCSLALLFWSQGRKWVSGALVLIFLGGLLYGVINPHHFKYFSSLKVRQSEMEVSLDILKNHWFLGIGQEGYRKAYWETLEGQFRGIQSYQEQEGLSALRFSSHSHVTPLSLLLYLGVFPGLLWLFCLLWLGLVCWKIWEPGERLALGSILLLSLVYDLFSFGVILIPVLILCCRGVSARLIQESQATWKRWLPVPALALWAVFWVGKLDYSAELEAASSDQDFRILTRSKWVDGELYHRWVQARLHRKLEASEVEETQTLLDQAHQMKPDPSTYYHRALLSQKAGDLRAARTWLQKGIESLPTYAPYYYARAILADLTEEELKDYQLAITMDSNYHQAWKNFAILKLERGHFLEAENAFQEAARSFLKSRGGVLKTLVDIKAYEELIRGEVEAKKRLGR
jgi:hypothetical protein